MGFLDLIYALSVFSGLYGDVYVLEDVSPNYDFKAIFTCRAK